MTAVAIIPLIAAVAGVIDYTTVLQKRAQVQSGLDAAGLAIAGKYRSGVSGTELFALGEDVFRSNVGWSSGPSFSYIGSEDSSGHLTVEVRSSFSHAGMIGWNFWDAELLTVVSLKPWQAGCLLALHPTASAAITMAGSTELNLQNCLVASNSNSSNAVSRTGAATLAAGCVTSVGATSGLDSRTSLNCPEPMHGQPPTADPLESVEPPPFSSCTDFPEENPKLLSPGTYCGESFTGNITLASGTYVLRGGGINLGGGGTLDGDDVTIFLMEGAVMTLDGTQVVNLTAPKNGPFAGIAIYQARDNTNTLTFTGGSGTSVTGYIYAPAAHVLFRGNSAMSGTGDCIRIVASTMDLSGRSSLELNCASALGGRKIRTGEQGPVIVR